MWQTYSEKLVNSNQVRTLVNFCEIGALRKLLFWIIYDYTVLSMEDKRILLKSLETLQLREFV